MVEDSNVSPQIKAVSTQRNMPEGMVLRPSKSQIRVPLSVQTHSMEQEREVVFWLI